MRIDGVRLEGDRLTLQVNVQEARQFVYGFKAGDYDIVPHKGKRSIDANAYMWSLCHVIGEANNMPEKQVYRDAIKRVGVYKDFAPLPEKDAQTLRAAWEKLGAGWVTEQLDYAADGERVIIRCYYGSSSYNTKQMSRLIDDLVQEADNMDLPTMEGDRIKSLLEDWDAQKNKSVSH